MQLHVNKINTVITSNAKSNTYIWPCSIHTQYLLNQGILTNNLLGILDNSPNKVGTYMYGYNLQCFNFKDIIKTALTPINIILNGGCFNNEIILTNNNSNITFINIL